MGDSSGFQCTSSLILIHSEQRVIGSKGVPDPFDRRGLLAFNRDDIKSHDVLRKSAVTRGEQRSCAYELALLVTVNRQSGFGKSRRASAADFNECQTISIEQDQVNFAAAGTKVARDGSQALVGEITKGQLFGAIA